MHIISRQRSMIKQPEHQGVRLFWQQVYQHSKYLQADEKMILPAKVHTGGHFVVSVFPESENHTDELGCYHNCLSVGGS